MAPRKRLTKNRNLEPNLYELRGYYRYRHPQTKEFHGMGGDRAKANAAARKLNAILMPTSDLVAQIIHHDSAVMSDVFNRYQAEYLPTKKLKPRTLEETGYRLKRLQNELGKYPITAITVKFLADYLDQNFTGNAYVKFRTLLADIFRWAITKGLCDTNPATETLAGTATEKQRSPLSWEHYQQIYSLAPVWFQIAMDFALLTLQRRSDLCIAKFEDIRDGRLFLIQKKTEKFGVRSHLSIQIGSSLDQVFKRARKSGIVSPFIIHRRPERIKASKDTEHWSQVRPEILSKTFAKYRDQIPEIAALPSEQRPTFHEIRALGGHLYLEAGFSEEYVQTLMGHSTAAMTAHYTDRHMEWTECSAELKLSR